jgi:hypothetical protein
LIFVRESLPDSFDGGVEGSFDGKWLCAHVLSFIDDTMKPFGYKFN